VKTVHTLVINICLSTVCNQFSAIDRTKINGKQAQLITYQLGCLTSRWQQNIPDAEQDGTGLCGKIGLV